jgi:hypothetical protein
MTKYARALLLPSLPPSSLPPMRPPKSHGPIHSLLPSSSPPHPLQPSSFCPSIMPFYAFQICGWDCHTTEMIFLATLWGRRLLTTTSLCRRPHRQNLPLSLPALPSLSPSLLPARATAQAERVLFFSSLSLPPLLPDLNCLPDPSLDRLSCSLLLLLLFPPVIHQPPSSHTPPLSPSLSPSLPPSLVSPLIFQG